MEEKVKFLTDCISTVSFRTMVCKYIPNQLLEGADLDEVFKYLGFIENNGEDLLQKLMDQTNHKLRGYGTAKELAANLNVYKNFTGSDRFFELEDMEPYLNSNIFFTNLRNETFIMKQDLLVCLEAVFADRWKSEICKLPLLIIAMYIKHFGKRLEKCVEFVRFDEEYFSRLDEEIKRKIEEIDSMQEFCLPDFINQSPQPKRKHIANVWKQVFPGCTPSQLQSIVDIVQMHLCEFPINTFPVMYKKAKYCTKVLIELIRKFIQSSPEMYRPYDYKDKNALFTVRCFSLYGNEFVMKSELFTAINRKNPDKKPLKHEDKEGYVCAMALRDVFYNYGDLVKGIDFVRVPIGEVENADFPVLTPSGDFCAVASNAFTNLMYRLILVDNLFQKIKKDTWHYFSEYVKMLNSYFTADFGCPYFITMDLMNEINQKTTRFLRKFKDIETKCIRNAKKYGFTVQDLRNELVYLGATDIFPEITDYAEKSYNDSFFFSKRAVLRTSELFSAIERCHIPCITARYPILLNFLHTQLAPKFTRSLPAVVENANSVQGENEYQTKNETDSGKQANDEIHYSKIINEIENIHSEETDEKNSICCELKKKEGTIRNLEVLRSKTSEPLDTSNTADQSVEDNEVSTDNFSQLTERATELEIRLKTERDLEKQMENLEKAKKEIENKLSEETNEKNRIICELKKKEEKIRNFKVLCSKISEAFDTALKDVDDVKKYNKTLTDSNNQLTKNNTELEKKLKNEQQKTQESIKEKKDLNEKINDLIRKNEKDISENKGIINGLRNSHKQCSEKAAKIEAELNHKKKEIENLQKESSEQRAQLGTLQMEAVIKKSLEEEIERNKETIKEMTDFQSQQFRKMEQLESLLAEEKKKTRELASETIQQLHRISGDQIEMDIDGEKQKLINELQVANGYLSGKLEEKDMMIKSFFDRIGPSQKNFACSSTQTEEEDKRHGGARYTLLGLWKIKDSFTSGIPLKLAKEVIEKMRNVSDESGKVHKMANYELNNYEGQIRTYLQSVEVNIEKIKKTGECHDLLPLSNYPSLSRRFIHQYWDLMNQEKKKKNDDSITDSECLFCYFEMKSNEQTLECKHCRKITHLECSSKWLRINRSCPNCRREQLDPTEFPPLS